MSEATTQGPLEAAKAEIRRLGLESYREELDEQGFVVIPPEIACPDGLEKRLLDGVLDVAERRYGVRPDLDGGSTHVNYRSERASLGEADSPWGQMVKSLLWEGPVFEEALMNPVLLAMTTYLCGYSEVLSSYSSLIKGPNDTSFFFHSDILLPPPWPEHALVCNGTYVLTPFDRENGSTAFLPRSHKLRRGPRADEINVEEHPDAVAIEAAPGSMVVWHGNTWHGAFNRRTQGLRVSIPILFARSYMRTEEDLAGNIPQEMLDRHPTRFAILTQQHLSYGWKNEEDSAERGKRAEKYLVKYSEEMGEVAAGLNPMAYDSDLIHG